MVLAAAIAVDQQPALYPSMPPAARFYGCRRARPPTVRPGVGCPAAEGRFGEIQQVGRLKQPGSAGCRWRWIAGVGSCLGRHCDNSSTGRGCGGGGADRVLHRDDTDRATADSRAGRASSAGVDVGAQAGGAADRGGRRVRVPRCGRAPVRGAQRGRRGRPGAVAGAGEPVPDRSRGGPAPGCGAGRAGGAMAGTRAGAALRVSRWRRHPLTCDWSTTRCGKWPYVA